MAELTLIACIDASRCIGCTKCIQVCPVDAIFGAAKYCHTVIAQECISCSLCVPACPVDCIDLVPLPLNNTQNPPARALQARKRVKARQLRLQSVALPLRELDKKAEFAAAIARGRAKKHI